MIYKRFQDLEISALGMGCMRLPALEDGQIDVDATRKLVAYAMEKGINYYDTAWGYHNGQSELVIGELLKAYPREVFYLASKFPGYDLSNMDKVEEIFEKQLEKCQVDYFDFYLFHCLDEHNVDCYLDPKFGIYDYLTAQKKEGRIRHLGFSAHANMDTLKRFLDAYGKDMEFCQLQINWLDWSYQNAKEKVDLVSSYGIPVWVMEPVRGGKLVNLNAEQEATLKALRPEATNAEWAFRFVQSIPDVVLTLSGMSNMAQLTENVAIFSEEKPVNEKERGALFAIAKEMTAKNTLPCTACQYCLSHCAMGLNIPWIIEQYNEHVCSREEFIFPKAFEGVAENNLPSACLGCGACEVVCPQGIKISEMMSRFAEKMKK